MFGLQFLPSFYTETTDEVLMVEFPAPEELIPLTSDPKTINMTYDEHEDWLEAKARREHREKRDAERKEAKRKQSDQKADQNPPADPPKSE